MNIWSEGRAVITRGVRRQRGYRSRQVCGALREDFGCAYREISVCCCSTSRSRSVVESWNESEFFVCPFISLPSSIIGAIVASRPNNVMLSDLGEVKVRLRDGLSLESLDNAGVHRDNRMRLLPGNLFVRPSTFFMVTRSNQKICQVRDK